MWSEADTVRIGRPRPARRRGVPRVAPVLAVALPLFASAVACSAPSETLSGPADVTVELDAYSGRPNPVWTLSPAQAAQLARRLGTLPERSDAPAPEATLGYRGFRVRNPGGEGGIPESVYVARGGLVQVFEPGERWRGYRDDAGVEQWLVELAREQGYADVLR